MTERRAKDKGKEGMDGTRKKEREEGRDWFQSFQLIMESTLAQVGSGLRLVFPLPFF